MSIAPTDFVSQAEQLLQGTAEVDFRSSISRAYYGLFHSAKEWAASRPPGSLGTGAEPLGSHEILISRLRNPAPECSVDERIVSKAMGQRLKWMKLVRCQADYELTSSIDLHMAKNACAQARQMISDLK